MADKSTQQQEEQPAKIAVSVEFSGGMELLMKDKTQKLQVELAAVEASPKEQPTVRDLIRFIRDNVVAEKKELFSKNDTVCPGILVIVNEVDWEVEDGADTRLETGDSVLFISTLHGG
ncbi:Ubiquitin- modifier 1 [Coemansia sp. RSA 2049]|nr:Ubiquitin- modifier 1 [Coemansia sp. RSA 2049]KAJ2604633.1 Ubiquitin- modifier 1 [Coemansia sp. RSA 1804]